jgi:hypothetical protein
MDYSLTKVSGSHTLPFTPMNSTGVLMSTDIAIEAARQVSIICGIVDEG